MFTFYLILNYEQIYYNCLSFLNKPFSPSLLSPYSQATDSSPRVITHALSDSNSNQSDYSSNQADSSNHDITLDYVLQNDILIPTDQTLNLIGKKYLTVQEGAVWCVDITFFLK